MDLRHLSNLRIFAIHAITKCRARGPVVPHDINIVLSTIPKVNQVSQLSFHFTTFLDHDHGAPLEEDSGWIGMCHEVVRISAGKPLELKIEMSIVPPLFGYSPHKADELYEHIEEKIAFLSDYPNICVLSLCTLYRPAI